jgi:hypothetical protein
LALACWLSASLLARVGLLRSDMPSTSKKQHNFMAAVANNPAFAKKAGVPQSVGKDFTEADKGKKFSSGDGTRVDRQGVNKPKTNHGDAALFKKGGSMASKMNPGFMAMIAKKKAGAKAEMPMKKGGAAKKMAAGGLSGGHKAADGVASKGKTKGKQIVMSGNKGMKSGGYC